MLAVLVHKRLHISFSKGSDGFGPVGKFIIDHQLLAILPPSGEPYYSKPE
jgi:hypothetical protein